MPTGKFPAFIDNTMRASFVSCPLKFKRSFIDNLAPAGSSIHLHAGGCFAKGLEVARKAYFGPAGASEDAALSLGLEAILTSWGDPAFGEETKKPLSRMLWAFDDYFREFPLSRDHIKPLIQDGSPAVEFSFSIPLDVLNPDTGEPLLFTGRFDMLGIYQDTLFVVDEKTTSQLGQSWSQQWDLKSQFTGYCAAARSYGYPVAGAIIRGIGLLQKETTFLEVPQYRPDWQIDRWFAQFTRDVKRMVWAYQHDNWDLALDEACAAYGGCAFRRLCLSQDPENWISGYFVERNWDPLAVQD